MANGGALMGWVRDDFPGHEGVVVGLVRRGGCSPDLDLYRELAFPIDADASALPADRIAAGCRCGWRSPRWTPGRPATYGPFSLLADVEDEEYAYQLWERHLVLDVGGDRAKRPMKLATVPTSVAALLNNHPALAGATADERQRFAADLEAAITALDPSEARATVAALLDNHRALAGATADEQRQLATDLQAAITALGSR